MESDRDCKLTYRDIYIALFKLHINFVLLSVSRKNDHAFMLTRNTTSCIIIFYIYVYYYNLLFMLYVFFME